MGGGQDRRDRAALFEAREKIQRIAPPTREKGKEGIRNRREGEIVDVS